MALVEHTDEVFSRESYEQLPIPEMDGYRAEKLAVGFGGSVEVQASDEDELNHVAALKLGNRVKVTVYAEVAGKGYAYNGDAMGYKVTLKVTDVEQWT